MEDHDGFEPESETKKPKVEFIMQLFAVPEDLKAELSLETAMTFQDLATKLHKVMPEGDMRTVLLERLLEIKDSALRALKDLKL